MPGISKTAYAPIWQINAESPKKRLLRMAGALRIAPALLSDSERFVEPLLSRCGGCKSRVTCTRWLVFGGTAEELGDFCPNAEFFARNGHHCVDPAPIESTQSTRLVCQEQKITAMGLWSVGLGYAVACWAVVMWVVTRFFV
jgi:hypothetical protein